MDQHLRHPDERFDKAAVGRAKLMARARRISRLRTRVVVATATVFAVLSGAIALGEVASVGTSAASTSGPSILTGSGDDGVSSSPQDSSEAVPVIPVTPDPIVTQQS